MEYGGATKLSSCEILSHRLIETDKYVHILIRRSYCRHCKEVGKNTELCVVFFSYAFLGLFLLVLLLCLYLRRENEAEVEEEERNRYDR